MATRSIDLECRETLCRETLRRETLCLETIFGICETDPDEVLEVLFECWKRSADDEATITETMDRSIEACMIRRAELSDSALPDSELPDSWQKGELTCTHDHARSCTVTHARARSRIE